MRAPTLIAILLASASCATGLLQPEANNLNATLAEVMARLDQMQGAMQAQQQVTRGQGDMAAALQQAYDRIARLESKVTVYEEIFPPQSVHNASALSPVSDRLKLLTDGAPVCDPTAGCNVCDACCKPYLKAPADCAACVKSECAASPVCDPTAGCNVCLACCKPYIKDKADCAACISSTPGCGGPSPPTPTPPGPPSPTPPGPPTPTPPSPSLPGQLKLFQSTDCPTGWQKVSKAQGFMLVGTPADGDTMTQIGTPLKNNEKGRVGPHTHDIIDNGHSHDIEDNGHSHDVDDPGHSHTIPAYTSGGDTNSADNESGEPTFDTGGNQCGVSINSAQSGVEVQSASSGIKVQENDDSDYYPQLHVLVCQKANVS